MNEILFLIVEGIDLNQAYYSFDNVSSIEIKIIKHFELSEDFSLEIDKEEVGGYYLIMGNKKPLHLIFSDGWIIFRISQEELSIDPTVKYYMSDFVLQLAIFLKEEKERQEEERIRLEEEAKRIKEKPNFEWL